MKEREEDGMEGDGGMLGMVWSPSDWEGTTSTPARNLPPTEWARTHLVQHMRSDTVT